MPRLSTIARAGVGPWLALGSIVWLAGLSGGLLARPQAQAPGASVPAAAMTGAGTAVLAGRAVDAVTGQPVPNTLLGLSRRRIAGPNTVPSATEVPLVLVMADAQGRFVIREIPEGPYLLLATAPGYIIANSGQGRAAGPTRTIDLMEAELRTDLTIKLWRHPVISGTVTDEAGEPVVGVVVRAVRRGANGPGGVPRYMPGPEAETDDRGQYRLTMLPPGVFAVSVPQTQVTVPASVVDTYVQAVAERGGDTAGSRLLDLMSSSSAAPSASGGVRVGDMLLQSMGGEASLVDRPAEPSAVFVYPTTFYGSDESGPSELIAVGPGEERRGVDIQLRPSAAVRLSGTVTAGGQPASGVVVRLSRLGSRLVQPDNGFEAAATVTAADGSFTMLGVTPGRYVLKALHLASPRLPPALAANPAIVAAYDKDGAPPSDVNLAGAQLPLTVSDADLLDLAVPLRRGATASGRVVFAGGAPPPEAELRRIGVVLTSEDGGLPGTNLQIVAAGADGAFEVVAPAPGRYMLTAVRVPLAWHRSGVTVGGRLLSGPIDLGGEDVTDILLTYTDQVSGLAGVVRSTAGASGPNPEVIVFAADRQLWEQDPLNPRQPRLEQSRDDGRYSIEGLLPGDYLVAAVDTADVPEIVGPSFLEDVARFAIRVTLPAGQTVDRSLTVGSVR